MSDRCPLGYLLNKFLNRIPNVGLQQGYFCTPGIYAEGYIVFAFPFVRLFMTSSRTWNLRQSFACKFLKKGKSHEALIRKHSYLDHRYP